MAIRNSLNDLTDAICLIDEAFNEEGFARRHPGLVGDVFLGWHVRELADAVNCLGNADEATPMGAIEGLGAALREAVLDVADAIKQSGSGE